MKANHNISARKPLFKNLYPNEERHTAGSENVFKWQ
jgi:hypothetical protein